MNIIKHLKSDPYLNKIGNCLDEADLNFAINRLSEIQKIHGHSVTVEKLQTAMIKKLERKQNQ